MRIDKLTTRFQQALSDAQSLAVGNDQQFIEPQHLLLALLNQEDGSTASLLQRAGANVGGLKAALGARSSGNCWAIRRNVWMAGLASSSLTIGWRQESRSTMSLAS